MIGNNACGSRGLAYGRTVRQRGRPRRPDRSPASGSPSYDARGAPVAGGASAIVDGLRDVCRATSRRSARSSGRFGRQVSGYSAAAPPARALRPRHAPSSAPRARSASSPRRPCGSCRRPGPGRRRLGFAVDGRGRRTSSRRWCARPDRAARGSTRGCSTSCASGAATARCPSCRRATPGSSSSSPATTAAAAARRPPAARRPRGALDALVVEDPPGRRRLWRIREDGAGMAGRSPAGDPAWPGWEDAAVPPDDARLLPRPTSTSS